MWSMGPKFVHIVKFCYGDSSGYQICWVINCVYIFVFNPNIRVFLNLVLYIIYVLDSCFLRIYFLFLYCPLIAKITLLGHLQK